MAELSIQEAEKLLAGVVIPPRPTIVTAVMEERTRADPDLRRVAALIAADVGLSAAVLKTINSPLYGLRRQISSIDQAVNLLGMKNIGSLVMGLALRNTAPAQGLDRFWDSATRQALLMGYLAKATGVGDKEEAYIYGLFHNCGIPLLMMRFPDYKQVLQEANNEAERAFTDVEDAAHGTNHAIVGSLLAGNWNLSPTLREAIRHHHDLDAFSSKLPTEVTNLIALGHLASHLENLNSRLSGESEWDKLGGASLSHLMIGSLEFQELERETRELLEESGL